MSLPGIWGQWGGYLAFFLAGFAVTEPWRWAGAIIGRTIDPASEVFAWVRAVATAIVAALCARLIMFPTGELAAVSLIVRVAALLAGIVVYFATARRMGAGIGAALLALLAAPVILR